MRRRTLLAAIGAGVAALAGCTGDPPGGGNGDTGEPSPTRTLTETPSPTPTPTETPTPSPAGSDFEASEAECGNGTDEAAVAFESDRVRVEGTASGADACHTVRLAGIEYEDGTLTVGVESYVPESEQDAMCAQCLVDVPYAATVRFDGGLPDRVVVVHDGERVTAADRSGDP
jgi:hypothetical protein